MSDVVQALALWRADRRHEAQELCAALVSKQDDPDALSLLAAFCSADGRQQQACAYLQRLSQARPVDASVQRRLGDARLAAGSPQTAVEAYRQALVLDPRSARAHNNLGQSLSQLGKLAEAAECYRRAIELQPGYAIAHNNLGVALFHQGEPLQALEHYARAIGLAPGFAEAQHNHGDALLKLCRPEEAVGSFDRALALKPQSLETLLARGRALQSLKRNAEALDDCHRALQLAPEHPGALSDAASALLALRCPDEALVFSERALARQPALAEAHSNRAGALRALNRYAEAKEACEQALRLKPDDAQAWSNLGNVMLAMHHHPEAISCCDRALELRPDLIEAQCQLGEALLGEKRNEEAVHAYEQAFAIDPHRKYLLGSLLSARQTGCDWREFSKDHATVTRTVVTGSDVVTPIVFATISDDPVLQLRCARRYAEDLLPLTRRRTWPEGVRFQHERIRVAYLSADFHQHATAVLAAGLFEAHDRDRFEIIALSFGPNDGSGLRRRLERGFDRFVEIGDRSDADAARLARSLEVDIAVDLKGYTGDCRPGIFTSRAAPVQVQYLGYPGTMGLSEIDYIVADRIVLPPEQQQHYSERVAWLPECYQVNDDKRYIDQQTPSRANVGLPEAAFVFCCFNNNHKITPAIFDVWMGLLHQLPGSVLWLLEDNAFAARNLRYEAVARGIDATRLVFAPRLPTAQHLARHRLADLFLDTLPYNAHTTTSDALWAGLPVLTCRGQSFQARVASSLLMAVGLPELVTDGLQDYARLALLLARESDRLQALRRRLTDNRTRWPLFNTGRFCRHLEHAYTRMNERHQAGLPPTSFVVPALSSESLDR